MFRRKFKQILRFFKNRKSMKATESATNIHNLIILDESGSMSSIYESALSGANETIESVRAAQSKSSDQNHFMTFVTFDSGYSNRVNVRTIIDAKPIEQVGKLTRKDYSPNGGTPLFDAVGISLTKLKSKVKEGDQVLVTIITDGMENSSSEYTGDQVSQLVKSLESEGWTFVFIGANQDSFATASTLNISNAMNFSADEADTRRMWTEFNESREIYYQKVREARRRGERGFHDREFFGERDMDSSRIARTTPRQITSLQSGEIFVFGSNPMGLHNGGAAGFAHKNFGAERGNPSGPQGRCYAIPTDGVSASMTKKAVDEFIEYAKEHPELTFLVTAVGCGNAGHHPSEIARMFDQAVNVSNIHLPREFWNYL